MRCCPFFRVFGALHGETTPADIEAGAAVGCHSPYDLSRGQLKTVLPEANRHREIGALFSAETVARRKLRQLQIAGRIDDLRIPPGNRLEALKGSRAGLYSIRVNDQFRICFRWTAAGAEDVEIVDYHQ